MPSSTSFEIVGDLSGVCAEDWDALVEPHSPFLEYHFLRGLEVTGCLDPDSGWTPRIVLARQQGQLVGALPLYLKDNSAGEFVFDWNWAEAAMRAGISYYPKGVVAVPFTPVTGARVLVAQNCDDPAACARNLVEYGLEVADDLDLSSLHFNFIRRDERHLFQALGLPIRQGIQYHWQNREGPQSDNKYGDFSDFLSRFRSKKRSNIRRERRKLRDRGVRTRIATGESLRSGDLKRIFRYYLDTVRKHFYGRQYLTEEFFLYLGDHLAERLHIVFCELDDKPFAGAFNLYKNRRLYGRYWGCERDINYAHFEACIYRPVQWCIDEGVQTFEPGAGGDHKFDRGFEPTLTFSAHYIRDPRLRRAVQTFIERERQHIDRQLDQLYEDSPFKDPSEPRRSS